MVHWIMPTMARAELDWHWRLKAVHILHNLMYPQIIHSLFCRVSLCFLEFVTSTGFYDTGLNLPALLQWMVKSMHFSQISIIWGKYASTIPTDVQSRRFWRSLFCIMNLERRSFPGCYKTDTCELNFPFFSWVPNNSLPHLRNGMSTNMFFS